MPYYLKKHYSNYFSGILNQKGKNKPFQDIHYKENSSDAVIDALRHKYGSELVTILCI